MTAPQKISVPYPNRLARSILRGSFDGLATPQGQSPPGHYAQTADAVLSYEISYSCWLTTGDSLIASAWYSDAGLTISRISFTTTTATAFISGGEPGYRYRLWNHVSTELGLQQDTKLVFDITQGGLPTVLPPLAGVGTLTAVVVTS
jgi:hypothetical protein